MEYSEDILDRYPQLSSIAETLEMQSEAAKEKFTQDDTLSSEYKNELHSFQVTKKLIKRGFPWQNALRPVIQGGQEEFDAELSKVLVDCPIGIEITVKDKEGKNIFRNVQVKTNPDEARKATLEKKNQETTLKGIESLEILKKDMEFEREKDAYLRNIDRLEERVQQLEEEVESLNSELDEQDEKLAGVAEEYKKLDEKKTNPPLVTVLGSIAKNVIAGLAVQYPKILNGLNLDEQTKADLIKQISADLEGSGKTDSEHKEIPASFEAVNNDLEGKTEAFKKIHSEVSTFLQGLTDEEANIVYVLLCLMITDGKFDTEKTKKLFEAMQAFEKPAPDQENQ